MYWADSWNKNTQIYNAMRISNDLHMIDLVLQDVNLLKRTRSKS